MWVACFPQCRSQEPDFEEDRIVVREGEEIQKKGWFSKNKPSSPNVSITPPPSANSLGQTQKPKDQANDDDSGLPQREEKIPKTTPSTPGMDKQQDDLVELPERAGFNLAAMREVLDGIKNDEGSRHDLVKPTRLDISPSPPTSIMLAERPQSASPPSITKSPVITPTVEQKFSATLNPTTPAVSELTSTSPEPSSLRDIYETPPSEREENLASPSSSRLTGGSTFSVTGYDGGSVPWASSSTDKEVYGGTPFGNPFHPTAFTAVAQTGSAPSNASIAASAVEHDPWSSQTYSKSSDVSKGAGAKQASSFVANPWES